jgi:hypothetical protein
MNQPSGTKPSASTKPRAVFKSAARSTPVPTLTVLPAATAAVTMAVGQVPGAPAPKKIAASTTAATASSSSGLISPQRS